MSFKDFLNEKKVKLANTNPKDYAPGYLGAAAISLNRTVSSFEFVLNAKNDGWFRKTEGPAEGYGLMVRDIRLTTKRNKLTDRDIYERYDIKITYLPNNQDSEDKSKYVTTIGWVWVHKDYTLDEVLAYINKEKSNWVP